MSFDRLADSCPRPEALATVLGQEQRRGRVERRGDAWRIVPGAFPPNLLAALDAVGGWDANPD